MILAWAAKITKEGSHLQWQQSCFAFDFEPALPGRHAKGIYEDSSMQHPTLEIWADYGCRVLASWLHSFVAKSILAAVLDSGKISDDSGETSQR